jgi:hypothetical protein
MKFLISVLLMALLSFTSCLFFPWWSIAPVSFLVAGFIPMKKGIAFLAGFSSLFLLWFGLTFYISVKNSHILAQKMSVLILKSDNPITLVLLTAFIGGLIGGFASLTGSLMIPNKKALNN